MHLVEDFHETLRFCWAKRKRTIGRLFRPQCRGYNEGDYLRLNPNFLEVLGSDGREV